MRWLQLPYKLHWSSSDRAVEAFFTRLELRWVQIPPEKKERYRIPQVTIPAWCAVSWAGCVDASASGPGSRIRRLDGHLETFLKLNQPILFGAWPLDPVIEALQALPWYRQCLEWCEKIRERDAGILMGSLPDMPPPPAMYPPPFPDPASEYPNLIWTGGTCQVVQSQAEEDKRSAEGWHAYSDPDGALASSAIEPPAVSLATWSAVEIWFLSPDTVQLTIEGKPARPLNYAELGFADQRNGQPTGPWVILRKLAEADGTLKDFQHPELIKQHVGRIRKGLRAQLERQGLSIPDDPLPYVKRAGYQAQFEDRVQAFLPHLTPPSSAGQEPRPHLPALGNFPPH